jgi:hypothetical protein
MKHTTPFFFQCGGVVMRMDEILNNKLLYLPPTARLGGVGSLFCPLVLYDCPQNDTLTLISGISG